MNIEKETHEFNEEWEIAKTRHRAPDTQDAGEHQFIPAKDALPEYVTTKEQCERNIKGVCEGCGGTLTAIETVDNSGRPTFWQGCEHCSCFRSGVEPEYFRIARQLVETREIEPYSHMDRFEYENSPDRLQYYLDSQTAGLSHRIKKIHKMLEAEGASSTAGLAEALQAAKAYIETSRWDVDAAQVVEDQIVAALAKYEGQQQP